VPAAPVRTQPLPSTSYAARGRRVIGVNMVLYSLGPARGAPATGAVFTAYGWEASSVLGAVFAACALAVWAVDHLTG
ncbi:MFS transporter, partial [Saccharothrix sp. MB29]|nr:MFS transporter [Saccharothrix sp. MB29]